METIGDRVRRIRDSKGIARKDLARSAGMSYTGLSDLESGKAKSTTKLHRLAAELGVSTAYLETGKGSTSPAPEATAPSGSQPVRLDPEIVRDVAQALQEVFEEDLGLRYSITDEPELFAEMYARTVATGSVNSRSNILWLGGVIERRQRRGEGDGKSKGSNDQGHGSGVPGRNRVKA